MPSINLASQRMSTPGSQGGLSPVSINGNIAGNIRAPKINANAGNTAYTNMPVAGIQTDKTIQMAAKAGMEMSQAAFDYQKRVDKAAADQAVLAYDNAMSDSFYGSVDAQGNFVPGFNATKSGEAVSGAKNYSEGVNGGFQDTLERLNPSAQALAVNRMSGIRNKSLYRGARHQSMQQTVRDNDILNAEGQSVKKDISNNAREAWENTDKINTHLAKLGTFEARDKYIKDISQFTLSDTFNREYERSGKPTLAYNAAKDAVESMEASGILGETNSNLVRSKLNQMKASSMQQEKADAASAMKQMQDAVSFQAPANIDASISSGDVDSLYGSISMIRDTFKSDPEEASEQVVSSIVAGIYRNVNGQGIPGANGKIRAADDIYNSMRDSGKFTKDEIISLDFQMGEQMPKKFNDAQKEKDAGDNIRLAQDIANMRAKGTPISMSPAPDGMNPHGVEVRTALILTEMQEQNDVIDTRKQVARSDYKTVIEAKDRSGELSKADIEVAGTMVINGEISSDEYLFTAAKVADTAARGSKKPQYQTDMNPTFSQGVSLLKNLGSRGALMGGVKKVSVGAKTSEGEAEEVLAYKNAQDTAFRKASLAWDEASRIAFEKGVELDPNEWMGKYVRDEVYGGDSSGGFWPWDLATKLFKYSTGVE